MTIYLITLQTTATHDAEKRADLNSFLKKMKRTFGLKCTGIEEREVEVETPAPRRSHRTAPPLCKTCAAAGRAYCPHLKNMVAVDAKKKPRPVENDHVGS